MEVLEIRALAGSNIYCYRPVIRLRVALGDLDGRETTAFPGFAVRLTELLPGLRQHRCSYQREGGFIRRLEDGTYFGHVVEHIAIELQCLVGADVTFGKTVWTGETGIYDIVYEYEFEAGAIEAGRKALAVVSAIIAGETVDIEGIKQELRRIVERTELGPSTAAIVKAARTRRIPFLRIGDGSLVQLGYGKHQQRIQATTTSRTGCIAADIACDKILTKEVLELACVPVPVGGVAGTETEAVAIAADIGYPVVVKPHDGNQGKGVTLNLLTPQEVRAAFNLAANYSSRVIVEKYIPGRHYRLIVVNGHVVAAAERLPAYVTGDGSSSLRRLVEIENRNPARGEGHARPLTKIVIDAVVLMHLMRAGLSLDSVPAAGERVFLRENANLSTGGIAVDVTDEIHPANRRLAERVAALLGLDIAGVDLVTADIAVPYEVGGGAVIEVNAAPGIRMHHYPSEGQARDVAAAIVDGLFPAGATGRIPLVAVTGTNGKTTTTRMVGRILAEHGYRVGLTTTDGIYIGGELIRRGDTTGPASALTVLTDPTVGAAVLETARGGILRAGLAYDGSDIGIVTNITDDHLGLDGVETLADLADVKSLVVETVRKDGCAVLNADDPYCVAMTKNVRCRVIYFSSEANNLIIRKHLQQGGSAVFVRDGLLVIGIGENEEMGVMDVRSIPATHGGVAVHNIQNALAAAAAAYGLGVPVATIRRALGSFTSTVAVNPGRMNIVEVADFQVMIDYGHNHDGFVNIVRAIRQMPASRRVGVVTIPGDRGDAYLRRGGEIAGQGFDRIIIKEDGDLRGRKPGEIAELLLAGVLASGMSPAAVEIVLDEKEAVRYAMETAQSGDLIVVFYEKFQDVYETVLEMADRIEERTGRAKSAAGAAEVGS
jgi:cyanophycin synthetase